MADQKRMHQDIETLRKISEPCAAGTQRPSYTPEYREGVEYMKGRMAEFGLEVREDTVGNLFGVLRGTDPEAPSIISGSHLDSVKCSGAFDGIAGVVCALEAARMIQESKKPLKHTYEVLGTIGEEGTRFGQVLIGSQFMEGSFGEAQLDSVKGLEDGLTLRETIRNYGLTGDPAGACRRQDKVKAFIELHAEQGPILENAGKSIGIVENIVAISWLEVSVHGVASHPGTIPMDVRHDAGVGAFELICAVTRYAAQHYNGIATVTTGRLNLLPGSTNCIPSECDFTLDIRTCDEAARADLIRYTVETAKQVAVKCRVEIKVQEAVHREHVPTDSHIEDLVEEAAAKLGYSHMRMNSGAGHDAMIFKRIWPAGMIFLPSHEGLTHHPDELVAFEDMEKGANVLYEVIRMLDEE
ncbi:M20 family metallo-hydrolase [Enterocloster lavalensis]|uniref:M20 family metallo-hydrolase n=1 Tax=Enterocloster lavalensis TaxID=460384 RepID=UPI001D0815D7|nr:M20 family metallo-hydrolase [Enterocloster lavalensis]MCB6345188.1 M20 family metallo-hydrolase [Enterocloster lavalensis]